MSSEVAISVNHLSKVFKLGRSVRSESLAAIATRRLRHPFRPGPRRERFVALDDVSFDVAPGEVVGVIGKNGAGKSTLLKILSRITHPTDGYVEIHGRVGSLLEVGTGFHPELTGLENVYLNGTILGMSRQAITGHLDSIIEFAEIDRFLDTPVKRYSSGMRVRLAFAVAVHLHPEILIIDEVLSVGDLSFQIKCLDKMRSIAADEGRTVLYVSHNLVTVENLCPRALLLVDGQLAFDGPTKETVAQYMRVLPHAEPGLTPGVFDLSAADRSVGDYAEVFKRLELRPGGGAPSSTTRMGERLRIEVLVEGLDAVPDPEVWLMVGSSGIPSLFRMNSRMIPLDAPHVRSSVETIVLDVPSLPLTPGNYQVHLQLKDGGRIVDDVRRAAEFTVAPSDILGNGYQFRPNDGVFFVPWSWEVRPSTADYVKSNLTSSVLE